MAGFVASFGLVAAAINATAWALPIRLATTQPNTRQTFAIGAWCSQLVSVLSMFTFDRFDKHGATQITVSLALFAIVTLATTVLMMRQSARMNRGPLQAAHPI